MFFVVKAGQMRSEALVYSLLAGLGGVVHAGIYTGSWKKGHPDSFWDLRGSLPLHSGSDLCAVVPVIPDAARRASAQKNVGQPGFDADIP